MFFSHEQENIHQKRKFSFNDFSQAFFKKKEIKNSKSASNCCFFSLFKCKQKKLWGVKDEKLPRVYLKKVFLALQHTSTSRCCHHHFHVRIFVYSWKLSQRKTRKGVAYTDDVESVQYHLARLKRKHISQRRMTRNCLHIHSRASWMISFYILCLSSLSQIHPGWNCVLEFWKVGGESLLTLILLNIFIKF